MEPTGRAWRGGGVTFPYTAIFPTVGTEVDTASVEEEADEITVIAAPRA